MSISGEAGSVSDWVNSMQSQYPDLPNQLTLEVELEYISKLRQWRESVTHLRNLYKDDILHIPPEYEDVPGGSQVIPALISIRAMSDIEEDSWHRLFSCAAPQLANITIRYWSTHGSNDNCTLTIQDPLNYLPLVFLYILSTYDEHRDTEHYEDSFAAQENRVRLTTWIYQQSQYHINTYLQSAAYVSGTLPNYVHTLQSKIRDLDNTRLVQEGRVSTNEELVEQLPNINYYASNLSKTKLEERVEELRVGTHSVSLDQPFGNDDDEEGFSYQRVLSDTTPREEEVDRVDGYQYVVERTKGEPVLQSACLKVLESTDSLTADEQYIFS